MKGRKRLEVPWIPTPLEIVYKALTLAKVNKGDVIYDLGCGDGRVVIVAAKDFSAKAVCIELNELLCKVSDLIVERLGLTDRVKVLCEDFFNVTLRDASVIYTYLYTSVNRSLSLKFENELMLGTRIITLDFPIPGWVPYLVRRVSDSSGYIRTLRLYVIGISNPKALIIRGYVSKDKLLSFEKRLCSSDG
ncbi:MAG TPA: class I SAM-dependent methyltransferase [Acidilobales archaeon]|nr:class I SAM-dependent methyltransferase [Acidilobales archaeon]